MIDTIHGEIRAQKSWGNQNKITNNSHLKQQNIYILKNLLHEKTVQYFLVTGKIRL